MNLPSRKVRLLFAYAAFDDGSGGEERLCQLVKGLPRDRYECGVVVIERARGDFGEAIRKLGCPLFELDLSRRFYNPWNVTRVLMAFIRVFHRYRPDIVHTQGINANVLGRLAAKVAGVPLLVSTDNAPLELEERPLARWFNRAVITYLDRYSDGLIVNCEAMKQMKQMKQSGRSDRIYVLNSPFNLEHFRHAAIPAEKPPITEERPAVIGVVGRLSPEKGHRYLLEALPSILRHRRNFRLIIVGSGPLERELKEDVARLQLESWVEFSGYVPRSSIFEQWKRMDIAVVPSVADARPIVVLEAMAAGLPVVGTDVGGIPEVVIHEHTGLIVPPRNSEALAQAILYFLEHPHQTLVMGANGRCRAFREFHPTRFLESHARLYESLITSRKAESGFRTES